MITLGPTGRRPASLVSADGFRVSAFGVSADSVRDPALAEGVLPNGLHYYVRVNRSPANRISFRLAVNAGSVQEDADQQGYAHFLEHMLFVGTRHFPYNPHYPTGPETPENSIIDFFETNGMRFGGDLNARTTPDETVYEFTLPTEDSAVVRRGLDLLEDWASGGAVIDSSAVAGERGVIMGEYRLRSLVDTTVQRIRAHNDSLWYGDSQYRVRHPIGDTTLIESALPAPIRRFYQDWYRPDLMAVVVVGDFNRAAMVCEIERRLGSIAPPAHVRPHVEPKIPTGGEPIVDVYRGPFQPSVGVLWPEPKEPTDVGRRLQQQLVAQLLDQHLEQRLLAIRAQVSRPFLTASLVSGQVARPLALEGFSAVAEPESLLTALAAGLTEVERVAQHGLPPHTLAYEKAVLLRNLEAAAGGALARPSGAYAEDYVEHFLTGEGTLLSPEQELALGKPLLAQITSETLKDAARRLWASHAGERVYLRIPRFSPIATPTRAQVLAIFDSLQHTKLSSEQDRTAEGSPLLATLPTPGQITGETRDSVAGTTVWTLSNGARVILKPSANDPDEVLIRAWGRGGFSRMPDTLFGSPGRMVAKFLTDAGGGGGESHDVLEQRLSTTGITTFQVDIGYADQTVDLGGSPRDVETLFQLLHLEFTAPKVDSAAIQSWASLAKYEGSGADFDDLLNQVFARGEPRLLPVATDVAELMTPQEALAAFKDRFGNAADFTFIIVGALTPVRARPLVERYLASLPSTGMHETAKRLDVRPFLNIVDATNDVLPVPKAGTIIVFDGPFPSAPEEYLTARQQLQALMTVLRDRIRNLLRMQLSADYSPSIGAETYEFPIVGEGGEHYRVRAGFMSTPPRMRALWKDFQRLLDSVRTTEVSTGELARALTIGRRQHETDLERNDYWLDQIELFHRLGIPLGRLVQPDGRAAVTPADLKVAAQRYLPPDFYIHLTRMPEDTTWRTRPPEPDPARR